MAKRRSNFRRKKSTYRKKRNGARRKAPKSIRKMVRREIARNIENKTIQEYDLGMDIYPSSAGSNFVNTIRNIGPGPTLAIAQGPAQNQRIGNRIKLKKLMVKGTIHPKAYNATNNPTPLPTVVKMYFFYAKEFPASYPDPQTDFFQLGGSSIGFQNDLVDTWAPFNTDKYRVLATRTFKVGYSGWPAVTGQQANTAGLNNNDFKFNANFSINCLKYMPKNIVFRDNNTDPTTRHLFMLFQCIAATGGQYGGTTQPCQVSYMVDCQYEDA